MKNIQTALMQKNGVVLMHLAQSLLAKQEGDRLETIINISNELKVGRGTVQTALKNLQAFGALDFETRGHKGSMITQIDYGILMKISGIKNLVGVMPLPYSKRYEGLATGIYKTLNSDDISTNLAFMSGAERRINSLLDGRYDFCIMSRLSAKHYVKDNIPIEIIAQMSDKTYVNEHILIVNNKFTDFFEGMRIGVDYSSFDQMDMTQRYFRDKNITIVPIKYNQIIESIRNHTIDGSIWSFEENIINNIELKCIDINDTTQSKENTQAVIVTRCEEIGIKNYFKRFFDAEQVESIQKDVISNKIMPNY
ncbi:MAG: GntR family transcriptional regulator YhfZ [Anaerocolumna sp.]